MELKAADQNSSPTPELQPIVVVSQCLGFAAVRYNGIMLRDDFVRVLSRHVRVVQVCPEVGIGLGVPREPIQIVLQQGEQRLVQPATNRDLTDLMRQYAASFLDGAGPVDGFILKSRSPSCGLKDVKVFAAVGQAPSVGKDSGLFAAEVLRRCPHAAMEDEGRLTNFRRRHHFLVKLFAGARLRGVRAQNTRSALVRFHTEYKLQWMAYSQAGLRELGRIVANTKHNHTAGIIDTYAAEMARLLAQPARPGATRNALMHAFGYVSDRLGAKERRYFLDLLEEYRAERAALSALLSVLRAWVLRFEEPYLTPQRLFEPYPAALLNLADSGGRDIGPV